MGVMIYVVELFLDKCCNLLGSGLEIGILLGYIVVLIMIVVLIFFLIDE